jgi:ribonuclease D
MKRPSKDEIRAFPLYAGLKLADIHLVENAQQAAQALAALENEAYLGFDTESKPTFRKGQKSAGPTLIQLATEKTSYLFPTRFSTAVAAARALLSNPNIQKVGFGLRGDNKELRNKLAIDIVNTLDLSVVLKNMLQEKNTVGARTAVAMVLKQRLGKGPQTSNWAAYPLHNSQIQYAANDAHAGICIANALDIENIVYPEPEENSDQDTTD